MVQTTSGSNGNHETIGSVLPVTIEVTDKVVPFAETEQSEELSIEQRVEERIQRMGEAFTSKPLDEQEKLRQNFTDVEEFADRTKSEPFFQVILRRQDNGKIGYVSFFAPNAKEAAALAPGLHLENCRASFEQHGEGLIWKNGDMDISHDVYEGPVDIVVVTQICPYCRGTRGACHHGCMRTVKLPDVPDLQ